MTTTQMVLVAIGGLAVLLSAQLLRSTVPQRRQARDSDVVFRQVGTFGSRGSSGAHATLPATGSPGGVIVAAFLMVAACGTGLAGKLSRDETHPDIRSAYGRGYERCIQKGVSRWKVEEIHRCIYRGPAS